MNIMFKHIFLNFDVISFIDKEMISFFQLHTYKFGLVYNKIKNTRNLMMIIHENPVLAFKHLETR